MRLDTGRRRVESPLPSFPHYSGPMPIRHLALALGCSTILLAACGGDDEPTPPTLAFTMSVTPAALSIQAGGAPAAILPTSESDAGSVSASVAAAGTGTLDVAITRSGGFTGSVAVTVEGLPTGVTASPLTIAASGSTGTITITAAANATAGPSTITVRGQGEGVSAQTRTVSLTITAAPGFSLAVAPATLSITQGQASSSQANITRVGGFTGAVALTSTGAPAGMTVTFTPASVTGGSAAIAVNVAATVATGNYPITIQGASTGVANQTATLTVTVTAPVTPTIALALNPATVSVQQGAQGTSTVTLVRTNFTGDVALTSTGAPAGMTLAFNPATLTGTALTSTATVTVGAAVPVGNHAITIQGAGTGVANATATLTVTVAAPPASGIAVAVAPTTVSIQAGASGTATLTLTRTNFTADVALTSTGAPAGMTLAFNPATLTGTTLTSAITVTVGAAVAAGSYPITLQGAGTGVTSVTTTLTVTVTAAAAIVLTTNPTTLSVQQGQSGTTAVTITRSNFTGNVDLTSSGAPAGVTVTFNPASTTGTTSTATVAVGAAVAAGSYQITITGAGTGITNATVTLNLTVTQAGGGSGNVTLTFCQQSGIPLWVAFSSNGGAWTQVTGTNNVYSFNITTRGIVAYVLPAGTSTLLNVIYGTQAELTARGAGFCQGTGATKTINATLNGVNMGEIGTVTMGGGAGTVIGGIGSNTVQLTNVQDGLRDLIAVRAVQTTFSPNSIVIQRDLNIPNNGSVTADFANGVAPLARTATIANLGAQQVTFLGGFLSKNFTAGNLSFVQPSTSTTVNWFGVPDASTVSGDFHSQTALATNAGSMTAFPVRAIVYYSRLATNQTLTLPDAITTAPTVTAPSNSPYVTINSSWAIQAPYNQFWTLTLNPTSGTGPSAIVSGSAAYFGSGPVQLNIPTFGAGFNPAHGLQAVPLTWIFTGSGGTIFPGGPAEGANQVFATAGGSLTP